MKRNDFTSPPRPRSARGRLRLRGVEADNYVVVIQDLLRAARPGSDFFPSRQLINHFGFLGPRGSHHVHRTLQVSLLSGLPVLDEFLRVRADQDLAAQYLTQPRPSPRKLAYYRSLISAAIAETFSLEVRVRTLQEDYISYEVAHDRFDALTECFVRFTIRLRERGQRHVQLERGDLSKPTARFRAVVERYTGADAEIAFLLMAGLDGVEVEEVVRGQIGPLHSHGIPSPPLIAEALAGQAAGFVLHLPHERAGRDVARDFCRDPWGAFYRDALSIGARQEVEQRAGKLGYHVAKDRRLICTPDVEESLSKVLRRHGARIVVRSTLS